MSLTGNQLLTGFSRFIGDLEFPQGLTTTGAGSTTTTVDTRLADFGDDYLIGRYVRITENVNGNQYLSRRATDFVSSTGTITHPAFAGSTASGTDYELHRYSPDEKFSALDEARIFAYPALGKLVYKDILTGDGYTRVFDIPSSIRRGPVNVFIEEPVSVEDDWNYDGDPFGDDTSKWSASSCTLSTLSPSDDDKVLPKDHDHDCTIITTAATTAATVTQTVANMANSITAARAADRRMTMARWVYCTEASKVFLRLLDDNGTVASGSYHQGNGWELLTVEGVVSGANATTLSVRIVINSTANASEIAYQRGWFYFGTPERVVECYRMVPASEVRRDNTTQQVVLAFAPERGRQIRLVGRDILTALGTTASSQATNTMEVDEAEAEILYAEAAKVLYRRGILSSSVYEQLVPLIQVAEATLQDAKNKWSQSSVPRRLKTVWG